MARTKTAVNKANIARIENEQTSLRFEVVDFIYFRYLLCYLLKKFDIYALKKNLYNCNGKACLYS